MFCDKIETVRICPQAQLVGQLLTQAEHAEAGIFQLAGPAAAQFGIGQNHRNQPRTVVGWK